MSNNQINALPSQLSCDSQRHSCERILHLFSLQSHPAQPARKAARPSYHAPANGELSFATPPQVPTARRWERLLSIANMAVT